MATAAKKFKLNKKFDDASNSDSDDVKSKCRPICPYGLKCYRKNANHIKEFVHKKVDNKDNKDKEKNLIDIDTSKLPPCKFGVNCYRKNLLHYAEYSHPSEVSRQQSGKDSDDDDDGDITDEIDDSGSEKDNECKKGCFLIKKSYSKMTDDERRKLISDAFEAKKQLEKELAESKELIKEKKKELEKLQKANKGILLIDGEKEALEGTKTKYFPLFAERSYKEGSADQLHFRLAESQFYRLVTGYGSSYRIKKVEYVVNPILVKAFRQAQKDLKEKRGEEFSYPILAFHGTDEKNITPICETGFKVPGQKGFKHKTDSGYYGAGVYFSEYPTYSMGYISGSTKLLLSQVLQGKIYKCKTLIHGKACETNYDSHTCPNGKEIVIFQSEHILPQYIVHYATSAGEFKYVKRKEEKKKFPGAIKLKKLYEKAENVVKKSTIFAGMNFHFVGNFVTNQINLKDLVKKHGGSIGTAKVYSVLIITEDEWNKKCKKKKPATTFTSPLYFGGALTTSTSQNGVRDDFIYDSIITGELKDVEDYTFNDDFDD